jgi:hypothetical protein
MKYALLIYGDETIEPDAQVSQKVMAEYDVYAGEVFGAGVGVGGEALQNSATATTVRVERGERLVTDGPFAEAREQLAGFFLIEADNLDAALDWAAKCPGARYGAVEVRPVLDMPGRSA